VFELGRASLLLPAFHDVQSLKAALRRARVETRMSSPLVHLTSRLAVWAKKIWPALRAIEELV
jgi:hypothetical protein